MKFTVSNFKSISEPVTLDIKPLTFLYGKNDVGKSTIIDAIDIFIKFFTDGITSKDIVKNHSLSNQDSLFSFEFSREEHIRMIENDGWLICNEQLGDMMGCEIADYYYDIFFNYLPQYGFKLELFHNKNDDSILLNIYISDELVYVLDSRFQYNTSINITRNNLVIQDINFESRYLRELYSMDIPDQLKEAFQEDKDMRYLIFKDLVYYRYWLNSENFFSDFKQAEDFSIEDWKKIVLFRQIRDLELFNYFGILFSNLGQRQVTNSISDDIGFKWLKNSLEETSSYILKLLASELFKKIKGKKSSYDTLSLKRINESLDILQTKYRFAIRKVNKTNRKDSLDKIILDDTFIESLNSTNLVQSLGAKSASSDINNSNNQDEDSLLILKTLHEVNNESDILKKLESEYETCLWDSENKAIVNLSDIGSGLRHLLPLALLCSLHNAGILYIEEPERHSHPSLQGHIADLLITLREKNNDNEINKEYIIESHSEYLLLRILRRIRESNKGKENEFCISKEDISINYIDTDYNNKVCIKPMPIDDNGHFIYDWPTGFFDAAAREFLDQTVS
jgi:predicted ATPase